MTPHATRRVRFALILDAIASAQGIEPSREEVEAAMNQFLLQFSSPQEAEKSVDVAKLAQYTKGNLRNEKVFQHLETLAQ